MEKTFTELTKEANYNINCKPFDNKSWRETERIEVCLTLEVDNEIKSFKGLIDLFGIIKKC